MLCSHAFLHRTALIFSSLSFKALFWWHLLPAAPGPHQHVDSTHVACGSQSGVCGPRAASPSPSLPPGTRPHRSWASENVGRRLGLLLGSATARLCPVSRALLHAQLVAEARDTTSLPSYLRGSYLARAIFDKWKPRPLSSRFPAATGSLILNEKCRDAWKILTKTFEN